VLGNHDDPRIGSTDGLPIVFLQNRSVVVERDGERINVSGVDQSRPGAEDLSAAFAGNNERAPTILLAHYPSTVFRLSDGQAQLVLSGHTHGGQIRLPWLGCVWPHDRIPRRMARGLHVVGSTTLHVSAGVGVSLPIRLRVNCPPEIAILTLQPALEKVSPTATVNLIRKQVLQSTV